MQYNQYVNPTEAEKLIDEYLSIVDEVTKLSKREEPRRRREYIKSLLTPLIKLSELPRFSHPHSKSPTFVPTLITPFIEESINIPKEIYSGNLTTDDNNYQIPEKFITGKSYDPFENLSLDPDDEVIFIPEKNKKLKEKIKEAKRRGLKYIPIKPLNAGCVSIRELHEKWLPILTEKTMRSTDLLDKVLVCYTIKRALNGDNKAIEKLFKLYEDMAINKAISMANRRYLFSYVGKDVIENRSKELLRCLISGFQPKQIISLLQKDVDGLPRRVEIFYFWWLSEYVPSELDKILSRPPSKLDSIHIDYLLNPYSPIDDETSFKNSPIRAIKFNSFCFRPNKNTNLTKWLFGTNNSVNGFMQGRFCQLMSEELDRYYKAKNELNAGNNSEESYHASQNKALSGARIANYTTILNIDRIRAKEKLLQDGNSERDVDIFLKNTFEGYSKVMLANKYNLSRKTIYRICNKIKKIPN